MLHRGRTRMKVAIMGAGALGGTFGFLLTDAGFDVTLVDVDERKVESIRDGGLTLIMPDGGKKTLPVKITSDPAGVGKVDWSRSQSRATIRVQRLSWLYP